MWGNAIRISFLGSRVLWYLFLMCSRDENPDSQSQVVANVNRNLQSSSCQSLIPSLNDAPEFQVNLTHKMASSMGMLVSLSIDLHLPFSPI